MRFVDWEGRLKNKGDPGNHGGLDPGMWVIDNNNLSNVVIIYDVEDGGLCHHHPHSRNNYCINDVDCQGCQRDAAKLNRARSDGELGFVHYK